jgi:hypothetical protein
VGKGTIAIGARGAASTAATFGAARVVRPPVGERPIIRPPVDQPSVIDPIGKPPVVKPPIVKPPIVKPPIVKPPVTPPSADAPLEIRTTYTLPAESLGAQTNTGAAALVSVRRVGRRRFGNVQAVPAAMTSAPRWAIVPLVGGPPAPVGPEVKTWTDYRDALATLNRAAAVWQLLPAQEAEESP